MGTAEPGEGKLPRVLGPTAALCVVVGSVIGSGIFLVPAAVADASPNIAGIATAWILGGVLSAAGALTLAELGAMMPRAGGPYVFLHEAYGPLPAFLFGWGEFWIGRAGSMATLAAAFARYFAQLVATPGGVGPEVWQMGVAAAAIAVVAVVNVLGTRFGGALQVWGTAVKVGALVALMALPFLPFAQQGPSVARLEPLWPGEGAPGFWVGVMAAMVSVLWAYDGWINLTPLAEEVRDPGRNIPRAMIGGLAILIAVYLGMTLMYHLVLPMDEIRSLKDQPASRAVAADYCRTLLGARGVLAISLVVMVSTFISLNGNALTGPRAYFAMARDGLYPAALARVHPRFQTPANAIIAQSTWAILLIVAGTVLILVPAPGEGSGLPGPILSGWRALNRKPLFDLLYTYVIFGETIFYLLTASSVFVLRRSRPELARPYRTWGYPFTPALYVLATVVLLGNTLISNPLESLAGLGLIGLGIPAFLVFWRRKGVAA